MKTRSIPGHSIIIYCDTITPQNHSTEFQMLEPTAAALANIYIFLIRIWKSTRQTLRPGPTSIYGTVRFGCWWFTLIEFEFALRNLHNPLRPSSRSSFIIFNVGIATLKPMYTFDTPNIPLVQVDLLCAELLDDRISIWQRMSRLSKSRLHHRHNHTTSPTITTAAPASALATDWRNHFHLQICTAYYTVSAPVLRARRWCWWGRRRWNTLATAQQEVPRNPLHCWLLPPPRVIL